KAHGARPKCAVVGAVCRRALSPPGFNERSLSPAKRSKYDKNMAKSAVGSFSSNRNRPPHAIRRLWPGSAGLDERVHPDRYRKKNDKKNLQSRKFYPEQRRADRDHRPPAHYARLRAGGYSGFLAWEIRYSIHPHQACIH